MTSNTNNQEDAKTPILRCKDKASQRLTVKDLEEHLKKQGGHVEGKGDGSIEWEDNNGRDI
jgi:hypothetical protein